jgi:hypothetical protein
MRLSKNPMREYPKNAPFTLQVQGCEAGNKIQFQHFGRTVLALPGHFRIVHQLLVHQVLDQILQGKEDRQLA